MTFYEADTIFHKHTVFEIILAQNILQYTISLKEFTK